MDLLYRIEQYWETFVLSSKELSTNTRRRRILWLVPLALFKTKEPISNEEGKFKGEQTASNKSPLWRVAATTEEIEDMFLIDRDHFEDVMQKASRNQTFRYQFLEQLKCLIFYRVEENWIEYRQCKLVRVIKRWFIGSN